MLNCFYEETVFLPKWGIKKKFAVVYETTYILNIKTDSVVPNSQCKKFFEGNGTFLRQKLCEKFVGRLRDLDSRADSLLRLSTLLFVRNCCLRCIAAQFMDAAHIAAPTDKFRSKSTEKNKTNNINKTFHLTETIIWPFIQIFEDNTVNFINTVAIEILTLERRLYFRLFGWQDASNSCSDSVCIARWLRRSYQRLRLTSQLTRMVIAATCGSASSRVQKRLQ